MKPTHIAFIVFGVLVLLEMIFGMFRSYVSGNEKGLGCSFLRFMALSVVTMAVLTIMDLNGL